MNSFDRGDLMLTLTRATTYYFDHDCLKNIIFYLICSNLTFHCMYLWVYACDSYTLLMVVTLRPMINNRGRELKRKVT